MQDLYYRYKLFFILLFIGISGFLVWYFSRIVIFIIVAMVIFVVVMMVRNPTVAAAVHTPLVQVVYAGLALLMCFGWGLMNKMIDEMV